MSDGAGINSRDFFSGERARIERKRSWRNGLFSWITYATLIYSSGVGVNHLVYGDAKKEISNLDLEKRNLTWRIHRIENMAPQVSGPLLVEYKREIDEAKERREEVILRGEGLSEKTEHMKGKIYYSWASWF